MGKNNPVRILICDDEPSVRESLSCWFREEGYVVDVAVSGRHLELQRKIKAADASATIILMTAFASVETAVEAMKQGAYDYVVKPIDPDDLEHLVHNAVERRELVSENLRLREKIDEISQFHQIVGKSAAMQRVLEQVTLVSQTDTTILIRGESGTGKELIARAIHADSPRRRYLPVVGCELRRPV
jgi:DNA-binding NtrC family response regulator